MPAETKRREMAINYFSDGVRIPPFRRRELTAWIRRVATAYGKECGDISYIFCNDEKILEVNREYLRHDYYTDIITFDYTDGSTLSGDIFISLDTVESNASSLSQPYRSELLRVVIHGILHLCGINDKGAGERAVMERAENDALALVNTEQLYKNSKK